MAELIDLTSWEPAYTGNPYPIFARLREQGPVTRVVVEGLAVWLVTRYEDIRDGLSDPRLSNDPELGDAVTRATPWVGASVATARHLLRLDPPDHTRLRRLVARAFTPRRIEALRPRIQQITPISNRGRAVARAGSGIRPRRAAAPRRADPIRHARRSACRILRRLEPPIQCQRSGRV